MNDRTVDDHGNPTPGASKPSSAIEPQDAAEKDHFLQLMFFQGHHRTGEPVEPHRLDRMTGDYVPLRHSTAQPGDRYDLPQRSTAASVRLDSPATDVMTDLRQVSAVTIEGYASIDDANQAMITHGVRALFVVDDARQLFGIVTATDILGERPVQFAQERGIRHGEIVVRDIMTPADRLEILDIREVRRARVGDIVATLKVDGRQHALAVDAGDGARDGRQTVCGIFSLTQIARQLGIPPQPMHDMARTFAEIEAVIAS